MDPPIDCSLCRRHPPVSYPALCYCSPPASATGSILFLPADTSLSLTADAANTESADGTTAAAGGPPLGAGLVIWAAAVNSVFLQLSDAVGQGGQTEDVAAAAVADVAPAKEVA